MTARLANPICPVIWGPSGVGPQIVLVGRGCDREITAVVTARLTLPSIQHYKHIGLTLSPKLGLPRPFRPTRRPDPAGRLKEHVDRCSYRVHN